MILFDASFDHLVYNLYKLNLYFVLSKQCFAINILNNLILKTICTNVHTIMTDTVKKTELLHAPM